MKARYQEDDVKWHYLIPTIFIVAILPLIVYLKVVPLTGVTFDYWLGTKENYDFFSYYKAICLVIAASTALFFVLVRVFLNDSNVFKREFKYYYIGTAIYLLAIIASTVASDYRSVASSGFPDRYEGVYVLIAYLAVFFTTTSLVNNDKQIKIVLASLLVGAFIIGTIGILQYVGYDLLKVDFIKQLYIPKEYEFLADKLTFLFDKNSIYATLYHYNYVGSYMAMLFPLCFALFVLTKNIRSKLALGILTLLMGVSWLACNSRAGIVGGVLALIVFLISINKIIKKYSKYFIGSMIILFVLLIGLNQISSGYFATRASSLYSDVRVMLGIAEYDGLKSPDIPLKEIKLEGNTGAIVTSTETLKFIYNDNKLIFQDSMGNVIESTYDKTNGKITLNKPEYKDYMLLYGKLDDSRLLKVEKGDIKLNFGIDERITLLNNKGNEVSLEPVESWGFEGLERVGSSRGYIWSRTIPLLKNTMIVGYGPDTFAIIFPQHDIFGKMYAYNGDMWQIVDKPHNLYLQIAMNTGLISLLAFIFIISLYLLNSIRLYVSNPYQDPLSKVGVGIFIAIVGYLGAAFFNDSLVSVAPIFWFLLGLGVCVNHLVNKEKLS